LNEFFYGKLWFRGLNHENVDDVSTALQIVIRDRFFAFLILSVNTSLGALNVLYEASGINVRP
jgi:hypothetical protein